MLDGRVDVQGTVKDLRSLGVLDNIMQEDDREFTNESTEGESTDKEIQVQAKVDTAHDNKKPRKLVKDEARETGRVKWAIYNTYLKAS